jgi:poly-gamma-glutamate synthesis protein (capsule biosynthesis protein)
MPHWGEEYSYLLNATQKGDAAAFVAAGADLVLGSHSHWVGGIETRDGVNGPAFIDFSLGDFLFNLNHDVQAQEGVLVTLTFSGSKLVQVNLEPTAMIQGSRVGLLNPSTDGKAVLDAIRAASRRLPGW